MLLIYMLASNNGYSEVVQILLKADANMNMADNIGRIVPIIHKI